MRTISLLQRSLHPGFNWLLSLLSLLVLLLGLEASTPGRVQAQEPAPPPHSKINSVNWPGKPLNPPPGQPFVSGSAVSPEQAFYNICYAFPQDAEYRKNFNTSITYSYYANTGTSWEILAGKLCDWNAHQYVTNTPGVDYDPRLSFDASRVVFVSERDKNDEIYSVSVQGGEAQRLTNHPSIDTMPTYSPDDKHIAFVSDRSGYPEIYSMNPDGTGLTQLTSNKMYSLFPDWSPDGKQIAFTLSDGHVGVIILMNPDGSGAHALTGSIPLLGRVRWSPSGTRLAFEFDHIINGWGNGWIDLGILNADGSGLMDLIDSPNDQHDLELGNWSATESYLLLENLAYEYDPYQKVWFLTWASQVAFSLKNPDLSSGFSPDGAVLDTDVRNPDRSPGPTSGIVPTQEWAQVDKSIDLWYWARANSPSGLLSVKIGYSNGGQTWSFSPDQYSIGEMEIINNIHWNTGGYFGKPGDTIYLLSNSEDNAGNVEPVHPTPDAFFRLYQYKAAGHALDMREHPLENVQVSLSPQAMNAPQTGANGVAQVYFTGSGSFQSVFTHPGLSSLPSQFWQLDGDRSFLAVLPGADERVTNGQFYDMTTLNGWVPGGSVSTAEGAGREGGKAAELSRPCASTLCLTGGEVVSQSPAGEFVLDSQGAAHVVTVKGAYFTRSTGGTWQSGPSLPPGSYMGLTISPEDTLWIVQSAPAIQLFQKPAGGKWTSLALPAVLTYPPGIKVDAGGRLHVVYAIGSNLYYTYLLPAGTWKTPRILDNTLTKSEDPLPSIAVAPDGTVHVLYRKHSWTPLLMSVSLLPDGTLSPLNEMMRDYESGPYDHPRLALGPDGALYAMVRHLTPPNTPGILYQQQVYGILTRPPGDGYFGFETILWKGPEANPGTLLNQYEWGGIEVDAQNTVHVALLDLPNTSGNLVYLTRPASTGIWTAKKGTLPGSPTSLDFFLGPNGQAHLLSGSSANLTYQAVKFESQAETGTLSQEITLAATMHKPTLSFFYHLDQLVPAKTSSVEALVYEAGKPPVSLLVKPGATGDWTHAWADLSPWLGKKITLQFRLNQAAGEYPVILWIDEVTVSSWTTPVLRDLNPALIARIPAAGVWVRVQGENLMAGSKVYLSDSQVSLVQFDAKTGDLLIWLPQSTPQGSFDLRVVTPNAMEETLRGALRVGIPVFLPHVHK